MYVEAESRCQVSESLSTLFFLTGYFTELGAAGLGLDRLTSQGSGHHPNSSSTVLGLQAW